MTGILQNHLNGENMTIEQQLHWCWISMENFGGVVGG